ncbi:MULTISPECIES: hypothetical protein [Citrobacter]|uniref:hypothetical protein n=1 Tax=Citrobacter TaxID=544 RepID=UPI001BCFD7D5|nr:MULTISPECIES: hypothetical protein [Citrobacter]EJG5460755.1 hypothetical protein [Salmonella enterica]ELS1936120.1 hypothetical protein [Salmonella enterica]MCS8554280.1 hypothetical protein [Citrobacter sp. XY323]MDM3084252.1 hypothetical protein [Citrobacter sp. Cf141]CAF2414189.1 hypothetical protein AI2826V1_5053 [Citrobacter freundii]
MSSQLKENQILHEGIIFNLIMGDPNGSDGYVYLQDQLNIDANFCVRALYNSEKIIAVLKNKNDAIAVSRYAASHDGGYGDVCIMSSDSPVTHQDHYDWILG